MSEEAGEPVDGIELFSLLSRLVEREPVGCLLVIAAGFLALVAIAWFICYLILRTHGIMCC